MACQDDDNINLRIRSNVLELKKIVQTMVKKIKHLKKMKESIVMKFDVEAFEAATEKLEKDQEDFQGKFEELTNWFKEKALHQLKKLKELERKSGKFKKEEVQENLAVKIDEVKKQWIEEAENSRKSLQDWIKERGVKLSLDLIKFMWLVLLKRKEENEVEAMIKRVKSLLGRLSVEDKHSCVIESFFSAVESGVESVKLPRAEYVTPFFFKGDTENLLHLIMEEALCLEICFNYPSLHPRMLTTEITPTCKCGDKEILDHISAKIEEMFKLVPLKDPKAIRWETTDFDLRFKNIWNKLDLPGVGFEKEDPVLMAERDGEDIKVQISTNVLELRNLVRNMEEEINNLKGMKQSIMVKDDLEAFEAATEEVEKEVKDLKGKLKQLLMGLKEKAHEEKQNWMELERNFEEFNLEPKEDSRGWLENDENYFSLKDD